MQTNTEATVLLTPERLAALEHIQQRILWLATRMVHEANHIRPNPDGSKIGGHQASSASMVTILTALYFQFLRPGDRVSVKPHAAPAYHALQYLLGQLPARYLSQLRAFGGLQAYPSRSKDPDPVDFSTGSVGLGAVAPLFAAAAQRYVNTHFARPADRRFFALIGDAELDEGNIWEAILDEAVEGVGNMLWIVDLNRQSLDRVVPGIRATRLKRMFAANGWQVLEAKYGRRLQALFSAPGGEVLRQRIDAMSNEEYQALIRLPGQELRTRLCAHDPALAQLLAGTSDAEFAQVLANLGGHDLEELLTTLAQVQWDHPAILFAYTIKGWGLPIAGHPLNHSMLLSDAQIEALREQLGIAREQEWQGFAADSPAGRVCSSAAARLYPPPAPPLELALPIPHELNLPSGASVSTQESFGRLLTRLADLPELRKRLVTLSPDVAVSTNLAGWINKLGVFAAHEQPDFETEAVRLLRWRRHPGGQHIELGISEMNLFTALGMFGLSAELCDELLIPIGTVYDPFVLRGLDALIYGLYSGSRFIFAGTPSGITLAPEGGAHQSTVTPSLGLELPNLHAYEPCFALELEWIMLAALAECLDRRNGRSTYLRLSTRSIEQTPFNHALERLGRETLRRQVLAGGYRLLEGRSVAGPRAPLLQIAVSGAIMPEALAAAAYLQHEGVAANVLALTSPRRLYERWQAACRAQIDDPLHTPASDFAWLIPADERHAPIISVHDSASHTLAWLGSIYGSPLYALGVDQFGQSGARTELYRAAGIDTTRIIEAAFAALDRHASAQQ